MKYLLLLYFLSVINTITAQNTYRINYNHVKYFADSSSKNGVRASNWSARLVYNDSLSFYYMLPNGTKKDKFKKVSVIGDQLIHHGFIYNVNTKEAFNEIAWPKGNNFIAKFYPQQYNWIFSDTAKKILGHLCKLAYSVSAINDTTLAWYSDELGKGLGPAYYLGLPGLALEVFDQYNSSHYVAQKIELTSVTLMFPRNVEIKYPQQKQL